MRNVATNRFAIVDKHGHYAKPFIDDTPYLLFKTKKDAELCIAMEPFNKYKIIKVRVSIEPAKGCS